MKPFNYLLLIAFSIILNSTVSAETVGGEKKEDTYDFYKVMASSPEEIGMFYNFAFTADNTMGPSPELRYKVAKEFLGSKIRGHYIQDFRFAFDMFSRSAKNGNKDSMNELGLMYLKGLYVKKDLNTAIKYFEKVDKYFLKNKERLLVTMKIEPSIFKYADVSLRRNKKFILEAIKSNPLVFKYVENEELILEAVKQDPSVFLYIDKKFTKDKEFILEAIKNNVGVFEHIDEGMKNKLLEENPSLAENINIQNHLRKVDQIAPALELISLDNKKINLNSIKGKVVLVQFWVSYNSLSRVEMPAMNKLVSKLEKTKTPFTILAVNIGEPKDEVQKFVDEVKPKFTILLDKAGKSFIDWNLFGFTSSFIIDVHGKIRYEIYGHIDWDNKIVAELIRDLSSE